MCETDPDGFITRMTSVRSRRNSSTLLGLVPARPLRLPCPNFITATRSHVSLSMLKLGRGSFHGIRVGAFHSPRYESFWTYSGPWHDTFSAGCVSDPKQSCRCGEFPNTLLTRQYAPWKSPGIEGVSNSCALPVRLLSSRDLGI